MKINYCIILAILFICCSSGITQAQTREEANTFLSVGLGFNSDSLGVSIGAYNSRMAGDFGFYANTTLDVTPPVDGLETQDYRWFSWHQAIDSKYENYIINAGLALNAGDAAIVYVGGGLAVQQGVTHWQSTVSDLNYWSYDDDYEYGMNFNVGAIVRLGRNFGIDGGFNGASSGGYANFAFSF